MEGEFEEVEECFKETVELAKLKTEDLSELTDLDASRNLYIKGHELTTNLLLSSAPTLFLNGRRYSINVLNSPNPLF